MQYINLLWNFFRLRGNTKKTIMEVKDIQDRKMRTLLLHAYDYSQFHRRRFEEAGITRDQISILPLSAFPTMDKTMLLEQFDQIVTVPDLRQDEIRRFDEDETERRKKFKNQYHIVHSSGSTGKPGYFVYDDDAWNQMLIGIIRGALWDMTIPQILKFLRGLRIAYIAATDGRYGGAMAVGDGIEGLRAKQLFLDINMPLSEWVQNIRRFRPNVIIGYPSAIKILGELVQKGMVAVDVTRVISCGEPLAASLRSFLEETFHADVINLYGASESLALGVETGNTDGMILFDDLNVIEVENGCMYLTSLYNMVQPLIRYRVSDQLVLKEANQNSGSPFTKAEILMGRDEDILWFEDENANRDFLHPLAVEGFCIEGLLDYQFRQTGKSSFEMLAETSGKNTEDYIEAEMLRQMNTILREKKMGHVRFTVRFVDRIMPDPLTGKKRLIINGGTILNLPSLLEQSVTAI